MELLVHHRKCFSGVIKHSTAWTWKPLAQTAGGLMCFAVAARWCAGTSKVMTETFGMWEGENWGAVAAGSRVSRGIKGEKWWISAAAYAPIFWAWHAPTSPWNYTSKVARTKETHCWLGSLLGGKSNIFTYFSQATWSLPHHSMQCMLHHNFCMLQSSGG